MINDSDIEIDGYEFTRWDCDRNGGCVALYVHKSLDVTIRQDLMDCNVESVSVQIKLDTTGHLFTHLYIDLQGKVLVIFNTLKNIISH